MSDTLKDIYGTEMPYTQYNTLGVIASAAPAAVVGVDAMIKANKAKKQLKIQQGYVDTLMTQYMNTPIYNPYKNVGVATKAAQMQVEETDKALANTLDTLRATGAAAGGATALAQAALKSKLGVSADIEKQEVANKQLEAKGEFIVQQAEMARKGQQMDYEQSKADQTRTEQFAYQERASDMAGALGSLGLEASRGLTIGKGNDQTTIPPADAGVDQVTEIDSSDSILDRSTEDSMDETTKRLIKEKYGGTPGIDGLSLSSGLNTQSSQKPSGLNIDMDATAQNLITQQYQGGLGNLNLSPVGGIPDRPLSREEAERVEKIRYEPGGMDLTNEEIYKLAGIKF